MPQNRNSLLALCLLLSLISIAPRTASAASPEHWVGTWAASPYSAPNRDQLGASDLTLRQIVHVSLGGSTARIVLSNEFGLTPLTIGSASLALTSPDGAITGAPTPITFSGRPSVIIPPGAMIVSDPAAFKFPPLSNLTVSLFVPSQPIQQLSQHGFAAETNFIVPGNAVTATTLTTPKEFASWIFLKGIDVEADKDAATIVTFGDSITDGALSTRNANARWPDVLSRRLQADKKYANLGILNQGIGGNRVLHDTTGPSALARFDRDVIAQPGVKYVVLMESINDIGHATDPQKPYDVITAEDLIAGFTQLITRAHTHNLKVIGATLTPYVGAKYQSPAGETMRQAVNNWLRTTPLLDGVIDFDKVTTDPAHPGVYLPTVDSGDHLHPADAGYKIMGESIDLKLFSK